MRILKWLKYVGLSLAGLVALLIIVGIVYEQISRSLVRRAFPSHGLSVSLGDHTLNVKSMGSGRPTVVFESGLDAGGSMVWGKVQDQTAEFASTVSYDRAGIMWSERGNNPKTSEAMADELYEVLKKSDANAPYILVGHSLAGYILRSFVAKHAAEVAGVVFVDAAHPDQWNRMPPELVPGLPPRWVARLAANVGAVRLFLPLGYPGIDEQDSLSMTVHAYLPTSLAAMLEELGNVRSLADEAGKVGSFGDIPLTVISGTSDSRKSEYPSEALANRFLTMWGELQANLLSLSTQSKQIQAAKSGHFVMLDQPELVTEAIRELVNQTRGSRSWQY